MPPIRMTSVMPTPMITISATCAVRFEKLPAVRNASRVSGWMREAAHSASSTSTMRSERAERLAEPHLRGGLGGGVRSSCVQRSRSRVRRRRSGSRPVASVDDRLFASRSAVSSAATRPCRRTRMRCARRSTSGRSRRREQRSATPCVGRAPRGARRSPRARRRRRRAWARRAGARAADRSSHLPSTTFCWLPPESVATRRRARAAHARARRCARGALRSRRIVDEADQREHRATRERGERQVLGDGHAEHQPAPLAILGHERDAGGDRVRAASRARRASPSTRTLARDARARAQPNSVERSAVRPEPIAPRERDHLAGAHGERDAVDATRARLDAQARATSSAGGARSSHGASARARARLRQLAARPSCGPPRRRRRLRGLDGADGAPVAQHGDAIAEREDLVHAVRHVDARGARARELAQPAHQPLALVAGERRGRLVEDQDLRVLARARARSRRSAGAPMPSEPTGGADDRCRRRRRSCASSARASASSAASSTRPKRRGSRPSIRFSATDISGTSISSWCTMRDAGAPRASAVERERQRAPVDAHLAA